MEKFLSGIFDIRMSLGFVFKGSRLCDPSFNFHMLS